MPKEIKTSCRASHQDFLDRYNQTPNKEEVIQSIIDGELKEGDLYLAYRKTGSSDKNVGFITYPCGCRLLIDIDTKEAYDQQVSERRLNVSGRKFLEWVKDGNVNLDEMLEETHYETTACEEHTGLEINERYVRLEYEAGLIRSVNIAMENNLGEDHFMIQVDEETGENNRIRTTPATFQFDGDTLIVSVDATTDEKDAMLTELEGLNIQFNA